MIRYFFSPNAVRRYVTSTHVYVQMKGHYDIRINVPKNFRFAIL